MKFILIHRDFKSEKIRGMRERNKFQMRKNEKGIRDSISSIFEELISSKNEEIFVIIRSV